MKIGILTFYREINFGANLQALSTYGYLKKHGHSPVFIYYCSIEKERTWGPLMESKPQPKCHRDFVDRVIIDQTYVCRTSEDVNKAIMDNGIEAVIVGSDAVLQHHPLIDRIKFNKRRLFSVVQKFPDTTYPNPFWGTGISSNVKMALMSVSCQDSEFNHFSSAMKIKMTKDLSRFSFISVRDDWTLKMLTSISPRYRTDVSITPDPVFNFNINAGEFILSKEEIVKKYNIPENYVLISMFGQHLSMSMLEQLKHKFSLKGLECVALPMQLGYLFQHPFDFEIPIPLVPNDWYALIKYSNGYIGNNMHPVVVALHNVVPCFSLDFYGTTNFWGKPRKEVSSKVFHILRKFGIENNYCRVVHGKAMVTVDEIIDGICNFPYESIRIHSLDNSNAYETMMMRILSSFQG